MFSHVDITEFLQDISGFLGCYYVTIAIVNGFVAACLWKTGKARMLFGTGRRAFTTAHLGLLLAVGFAAVAAVAWTGDPEWIRFISLPEAFRGFLDRILNATSLTLGVISLLLAAFCARRWLVEPVVGATLLNAAFLFVGLSLPDPDFAAIVLRADNVPIVGLVFLLAFFTWVGAAKAAKNDERTARGAPPLEAEDRSRVLVWPDLVYIELICMVALTALLIVWSIGLRAPLEAPANPGQTPNPSKAPWYFVGLQEMLVYFDPWMAGVVLPTYIILGLIAIPYLDRDPVGSGYYTIGQRKFAYLVFQFGFLVLWILLILLGTFLRGSNWSFFGPYETWDLHKVTTPRNVDLAQRFWGDLLGVGRPRAPDGAGLGTRLAYILLRESPGLVLMIAYFVFLPAALARVSTFFRGLYAKMGLARYVIMTNLLLVMALLPIKMLCRWTADLSYFVAIPEYFLNF